MEGFGKAQEASLRTNKLSLSPGAAWVGNVGKRSGMAEVSSVSPLCRLFYHLAFYPEINMALLLREEGE